MTHRTGSSRSAHVAVPAAVALAAIVAACASNPAQGGHAALAPQEVAAARQKAADVYLAPQVSKAVAPERGNMPPQYPDVLKSAGIGGFVVMSFVVDTTGRIDVGSATIAKLSDDRFVGTVVAALPALRFTPAELGGRKVKQLVSQPFYFGMVDTTLAHGAQTVDQAVKTLNGSPLHPIKP